ncbi:MAG TPA: glutamyl-tRNA reductase, partial [Opitutales bacterium]|nr:glutamyl-tRNA reductase [Opitutales bacterium]
LVLNTCNRVELYGVAKSADEAAAMRAKLLEEISRLHMLEPGEVEPYTFFKQRAEVVEHVFGVAAGLDSQMLGETEILGQVKDSYADAMQRGTAGPVLNRVFQKCFQAAKWARTNTVIGRGAVSVGSVSVELATRMFGGLERSRVLLIGAGEVGQGVLQSLRTRGARDVTITSRTLVHAFELAMKFECVAVELNRVPELLARADIVLCAMSSETPVVTRAQLAEAVRRRAGVPLFVIDLAVPRNVEPTAAGLENIFLYNLDDLAAIANENLKSREAAVTACRETLTDKARQVWESLRGR